MQEPPEPSEQSHPSPSSSQAQAERAPTSRLENGGSTEAPGHDYSTMATLVFCTLMCSVLIVLMVVIVNSFTVHHKQADVVDNAALLAARELSQVTVDHASFGLVGLCDLPADRFGPTGAREGRVISLASLYETLHIDREIAKKLGQKSIESMAQHDTQLARKVEQELAQKLRQAVEPDTAQTTVPQQAGSDNKDQDNVVYRDVYRMISGDREAQAATSIELKIYLGRATTPIFTREETRLINGADFVRTGSGAAPYLVLVDAQYEVRVKGSSEPKTVVKRACALIGAPTVDAPPAAFVINFPQGIPPTFRSAHDILFNKNWNGKGDWQQAVGSEVPGKGSLAPPLDPVMPSMVPADAMAVGLYHWLRSAGASVDPELAVELINSHWDIDSLAATADRKQMENDSTEQATTNVNSCLARDTGAREYSIMNQTGPSSIGQTALCRAFAVFDQTTQDLNGSVYPQSALPLFIDQAGNCNLAGREGFNTKLVKSFLSDVHDTNIAAATTLAVAKQFVSQSTNALNQTEQRIFIEKQELSSVTSRLATLTDEASKRRKATQGSPSPGESANRILVLAQERIDSLKSAIASDEQKRANLLDTHNRATLAISNATKAATATFELCAHAFKSCREGIYQIDSPQHSYLIGKKFIFVPNNQPLSENDFFAELSVNDKDKSNEKEPKSPWFSRNMATMAPVEAVFSTNADQSKAEGRTLKEILQEKSPTPVFRRGMIVLDSRSITRSSTGTPVCRGYKQYAFSNIAIPSGQLLYYCQNATESGRNPKVSWSMLLRDLVATRSNASDIGSTGNPIPSQERAWCADSEHGQCPGLACELQIRCPLPILTALQEDTYLKEPGTNAQVPQIPPVPADML